jgi:hypothetical protein
VARLKVVVVQEVAYSLTKSVYVFVLLAYQTPESILEWIFGKQDIRETCDI